MFQHIPPRSHNLTSNFSEFCSDVFGQCDGMMSGILAWASLSTLFSLVGLPACVAVFWELFRRHKTGTPTTPNDVFMLNLTIMDYVFLLFVPLGVCNVLLWHNRPFKMFIDFLYALNLDGRPLLTTCVCLDCYLAVVHPVTYCTRKSLTPRVLVSVGVWAIIMAEGIIFTHFDDLHHSPWATLSLVLTFPVIVFCDFSILWTLKKSPRGGRGLHPQKKKALQIITSSLVLTVITYVPPVLGYILGAFIISSGQEYECILVIPILIIPTAGSTIMPMMYLGTLGKLNCLRYLV